MTRFGQLKFVFNRTLTFLRKDRSLGLVLLTTSVARLIYFTMPLFYLAWMLGYMRNVELEGARKEFTMQVIVLFTQTQIYACIAALVLIPLFGLLSDSIPSDVSMVLSFGLRMSAAVSLYLLDLPFGPLMQIIVGLLVVATFAEHLAAETFMLRKIPGDIRSAVQGCVHAFALVLTCAFHLFAWFMVQRGYPATMPMVVIGGFDAFVMLLAFGTGIANKVPETVH